MKEGKWTAKLLADLRKRMQRVVILKHNNPYTAGVPDFSVTHEDHDRTTWCEIKILDTENRGSGGIFRPLQVETAKRMRAWYLIWLPVQKRGYLFRADEIRSGYRWTEESVYTYEELVDKIARTF